MLQYNQWNDFGGNFGDWINRALMLPARREHPALTNDVSPDNVVNSLLNIEDILLGGPAAVGVLSALNTGKVVVAILVDWA
jgi:hypothetical protein